jgi:hypothetical protein
MGHPQALKYGRRLFFAICVFGLFLPETGSGAPQWVATYPFEYAENILLGPDGSVYTSGYGGGGLVIKYSPAGERLWAVKNTNIGRVAEFWPLALTGVDSGGGVRMTGPWTGMSNDLVVASYSAAGSLRWERRIRESLESRPHALAVDGLSNTIVVGRSVSAWGTAGARALILKYSPWGVILWTNRYLSDAAYSVVVTPNNEIVVGGGGPVGGSGVVLKYTSAGQLIWATKPEGEELIFEMKLDASGSIIGLSRRRYAFGLFKLSANGEPMWSTALTFRPTHVTAGSEGSVYVTGGEGSGSIVTATTVVARYDADGRKQWTTRFADPNSYVAPPAGIEANDTGISVAVGISSGTATVFHYDHAGVEVWRGAHHIDNVSVPWMVGDNNGGIYVAAAGRTNPVSFTHLYTLKFNPTVSSALPTIISAPQDLEVVSGTNSAVFSVEAGNGPHTFQWRQQGVAIPGATSAVLQLTNIYWAHAQGYSVIVSNAHGFVVTPEAQLTVHIPPRLSWHSSAFETNRTLVAGDALSILPRVDGTGPFTFEWRRNGVLLSQTNTMLVIDPVSAVDAGSYTVTVRSPYGFDVNAFSVSVIPPTRFDEWRWVQPRPQGNDLHEVAFGNGRFVAVGDFGTLLISTNGIEWSSTNLNNLNLIGVSFGNGTFVALTREGPVYRSTDGLTWAQAHLPPFARGVKFVNDRFVIYGSRVLSSANGVTWIDHGTSPREGVGLAAGNGRYLMPASSTYGGILVSTNLSDWAVSSLGGYYLFYGVAYGNGVFVFSGGAGAFLTQDGTNFWDESEVDQFGQVGFLNGLFYALGNEIQRSPDGTNWSQVSAGYLPPLTSGAYGNGTYVAVGNGGTIAFSPNGQNWTRLFEQGNQAVRDLVYGNGRYVMITQDRIWTSFDGEAWMKLESIQGEQFSDVIWANGTFVIADEGGALLASSNGTDWTHIATDGYPSTIAHDGERFVAAGDRSVVLYTNAFGYRRISSPALNYVNGIAFGGGSYVIASGYEGLLVSSNAVDWRTVHNGGFDSVVYQNGRFVAVGWGVAYVSSNGLAWTTHPVPDGNAIGGITFGGGTFVVSAFDGRIATSTNGQNWVVHRTRARGDWAKVSYAKGAFWLMPWNEGLIRSAQIEPAIRARKTGTGIELTVQAYPGQSYRLQRGTALGTWSDFQVFTPQNETTTLIDNDAGLTGAFYRIVGP